MSNTIEKFKEVQRRLFSYEGDGYMQSVIGPDTRLKDWSGEVEELEPGDMVIYAPSVSPRSPTHPSLEEGLALVVCEVRHWRGENGGTSVEFRDGTGAAYTITTDGDGNLPIRPYTGGDV